MKKRRLNRLVANKIIINRLQMIEIPIKVRIIKITKQLTFYKSKVLTLQHKSKMNINKKTNMHTKTLSQAINLIHYILIRIIIILNNNLIRWE